MLSIIALSIIAIGIVSALGYGALSTIRATETVTMAQRNVAQMETVTSLLRASIRPVGGGMRAPMGDAIEIPGGATLTGLPLWVGGNRSTPWGAPYAYCPYANTTDGGDAATVVYGDGGTGHAVGTQRWPGESGHLYVVSSDAPPMVTGDDFPLVLVLSPVVGKSTPPRCDDVMRAADGAWRIDADAEIGGTVAAITNSMLAASSIVDDFEVTLFAATAAEVALGDGSGRTPASPMTLSDALSLWRANLPRSLTIRMAPGHHVLTAADGVLAVDGGVPGRGLRLLGSGAVTIGTAEDGLVLKLPGDVALDGITIGDGILVQPQPGSRLMVRNSALPRLEAVGADVTVEGQVMVTGEGTPTGGAALHVGAARLVVTSDATLSIASPAAAAATLLVDNGGEMNLALGGELNIAAAGTARYGVRIDGGARFTSWGGAVTMSGNLQAAFVASGDLLGLFGTPVSFGGSGASVQRWIELRSGMLDLRSFSGGAVTRLGSSLQRATVGVKDLGGHALAGSSATQVHAAACFDGLLFPANSYESGDSAAKSVLDTNVAAANRATWTCH